MTLGVAVARMAGIALSRTIALNCYHNAQNLVTLTWKGRNQTADTMAEHQR